MSGFLLVQKLLVSLLRIMLCSRTSRDTGKYLGKKENYLTGVWVGNLIALIFATLVSSFLYLLVYLSNNDHGHSSFCM